MGTVQAVTKDGRPLAWSFSRLIDFEKCARWAHKLYVEKQEKPATLDTKAADRGHVVHKGAEDYILGATDEIIDDLKKVKDDLVRLRELNTTGIVEVEQEWAFDLNWQQTDWFAEETWARIKLDVFVKHPDAPWEVIDWKTGKRFFNEVKHAQQGLLYAIAAFLRYPEMEKVRIRFIYTDEGKESPHRVYERATIMRMFPTWDDRARKFTFATEWPAKPNAMNCRFCPWSPNNGGDNSCPVGVKVEAKAKKK
jgi:hypothetical protein